MIKRQQILTPLRVAILALALLASSCGSSDDSVDGSAEPDATVVTAPGDDDATAPEPSTPAEPTASFRGVTPEVIRVGVATFDWDSLAASGFFFGRSNTADLWNAALEEINARGGVHGRMLELYTEEVLPLGSVAFDEACSIWADDEEIFVLVGSTLDTQILCLIDLNETAAVTSFGMSDPILDQARAPYATLWASYETQAATLVELIEAIDALDGATIGIMGSVDLGDSEYQSYVDAFVNAGYDVVEGLIGATQGDLTEATQSAALVYERMQVEGVDFTVATTGVPLEIANAEAAGYDTGQWMLTTVLAPGALEEAAVSSAYLDGALVVVNTPVATTAQTSMGDDPLVAECVDHLIEETGHALTYDLDVEINDLADALYACSIADILEAALLAAGVELTNDSFQAGLESIGDIELPGYFGTSLTSDDLGAAKTLRLARFDADANAWVLLD